jgi:hypothetical protein
MSDKKRRDITLGEMQDECSFRGRNCETVGGEPCEYHRICNQIRTKGCLPPEDWDLSDPPRFNEAQMAFLRGCYGIGIFGIMRSGERARRIFFTKFETVGFLDNAEIPLEPGETLDLVELFGKEGV